jgi:nucleoside-diphosphate-sugar epimerase
MSAKPTILVTGAGGFVGGRVCEILYGGEVASVRAGVRRWSSAARIGRLPVEIVPCDVTNTEEVNRAVGGATAVVHCAVGDRAVTVEGTRNVLEAAQRHGVERVVHISTIAVYGEQTGALDESAPVQYTGNAYGDSKIAAEEVCESYADRVHVTMLRPSIVYGPFSQLWTIEFASRMQSRPWPLPSEYCGGTCNLVYVDDVVGAILRALQANHPSGRAYNVNGTDRPTWHEYFHALNNALGFPPLVTQSATTSRTVAAVMQPVRTSAKYILKRFHPQVMALYHRSAAAKALMRRAEAAIRQTPTTNEFHLYSKVASFPSEKATRELGYEARFEMNLGIANSVAWLRRHGYVPANGTAT